MPYVQGERSTRFSPTTPDFKPIVDSILSGKQDDFSEIDNYLRPILKRYFHRRLPQEDDDLTQDTLIGISQRLLKFKHAGPKEDFSKHFINWCFTIAVQTLNHQLRKTINDDRRFIILTDPTNQQASEDVLMRRVAQETNQLPSVEKVIDQQQQESEQEALWNLLRKRIADILPPREVKIVNSTLDGKTHKDIAKESGMKERTVICALSRARLKIEREILFPAGYKRAIRFGGNIKAAARKGKLSSSEFLGMFYTTDEAVTRYNLTKQSSIDTNLLSQGYVALSESVSEAEEEILAKRHYPFLIKSQGRLYIKPEDLEGFRQMRITKQSSKTFCKESCYAGINTFTKTAKDHRILRAAAKRGQLKAIKENRVWLTTASAVNEFRLQKSGVIFNAKDTKL